MRHLLLVLATVLTVGPAPSQAQAVKGLPAPEIRLAPPVRPIRAEPAPTPDAPDAEIRIAIPGAATAPEAAEPIERVTAEEAPPPPAPWILPLVPAEHFVPERVGIGASLPQRGILRLTGEVARAEMILELPPGAPLPAELTLATRSSVNVLPDSSAMRVIVNGAAPVDLPLDSYDGFAPLKIPATGLVPGRNQILVEVRQTHRIYCGPAASFALWTEIALAESGAPVPAEALPEDAAGFLAALRVQAARGPVAILTDGARPQLVEEIARAVTRALGFYPGIATRSSYAMAPDPEAARIALIASGHDAASFRRGADGALVMTIEYATALPDLAALLPAAALGRPIPALQPGAEVTLASIGDPVIVGNTRFFRRDVPFLLPGDWLLLASQKARLRLVYGFAGNLPRGAMLLVKVNDRTVRLLPLDKDGGKVQPPLDVDFSASLLNPSVNQLSFEMVVPGDPPGLPCTEADGDMLAILGDSTLHIPPSPRMERDTMARALVRLSGADVRPVGRAASWEAARLLPLLSGLEPVRANDTGARLVLVSLEDAGLIPTGDSGLERQDLQALVYPELAPRPADPVETLDETAGFHLGGAREATETPDAARAPVRPGILATVAHWSSRQLAALKALALPSGRGPKDWVVGKSGEAALIHLDPGHPETVWLVTAPGADMTRTAAAIDRLRRDWRGQTVGQLAILHEDGSWDVLPAASRPRLTEPLGLANLRTVLGNYASWSPILFAIFAIGLAVLSVIPALLYVVFTRQPGSRY